MRWSCIAVLLVVLVGIEASGGEQQGAKTVNVADFATPTSLTGGIQEAIDSLPRGGGGTVIIPPGKYVLRHRVNISKHHHLTLKGAGERTILTRPAQAIATLTKPVLCTEGHVSVDSTKGFRVGDEVVVYDSAQVGWNLAHCRIKAISPGRLQFETIIDNCNWLYPGWSCLPKRGAKVINRFPGIAAGWTKADPPSNGLRILDLTIDGNLKENPDPWTDFTTAAIHFQNGRDVLVRNVTVRGWPSDGISAQWGGRVRVEKCIVEDCHGHGIHPGTDITGATIVRNTCRNNGGDGIFFCMLVKKAVVSNNLIIGNRGSGIGNLGYSGDQHNIVSDNRIESNGLYGIDLRSGKNNVIKNNVIKNNSRSKPGHYSEIVLYNTSNTVVESNTCLSSGSPDRKTTQRFAIEVGGHSTANTIRDNKCQDAVNLTPPLVSGKAVDFQPTLLRGGNSAFLAVKSGVPVKIVLRHQPLGGNKGPLAWTVQDSNGQPIASGTIPDGKIGSVEFMPEKDGICLLNMSAGRCAYAVVSVNAPITFRANQRLAVILGAKRLYFHVPAEIEQFTIAVEGVGSETVRLNVFDPKGRQVATTQTTISQKRATVNVTSGSGSRGVWSLELTKADEGSLEDASVTLDAQLSPLSMIAEHVFQIRN